jgi:hypothetical protein
MHKEGWEWRGHKVNIENRDDSQRITTSISLRKAAQHQEFKSEEPDVSFFAFEHHSFRNPKGTHEMRRVKNLNQYWEDVRNIVDEDGSKMRSAVARVSKPGYNAAFDADRLLEEAYRSEVRPFSKRYLPLKEAYFEVAAEYLVMSQIFLADQERLVKANPQVKKFIDASQAAFSAFMRDPDPISNFQRYRLLVDIDLRSYAQRLVGQLAIVGRTLDDLVKKGSMSPDEAVPRLLEIYKRILEVAAPILNVLRISLELKSGTSNPTPDLGLSENVRIIRSGQTGGVFDCLDPNLRHADAHAAHVEIEGGKVRLFDHKSRQPKLVAEYPIERIGRIVQEAHQALLPAIVNSLILVEMAMKDLLLLSPGHRFYILGIGNT